MDPAFETGDVILNQMAAVRRQTVPYHQQRKMQMSDQGLEKVHYLGLLHRAGLRTKVEVPQREPGGHRQTLPVEVVLQDGRLSARCPSAAAMRPLAQPAFVDEDEDAPFAERFFLRADHTFFLQCWIALRCVPGLVPWARCGLQRRLTRIFHTCPS